MPKIEIDDELLMHLDSFKHKRRLRSRGAALADLLELGLAYAACEDAGVPMDKIAARILFRDVKKRLAAMEAKQSAERAPASLV